MWSAILVTKRSDNRDRSSVGIRNESTLNADSLTMEQHWGLIAFLLSQIEYESFYVLYQINLASAFYVALTVRTNLPRDNKF